MAVHLRAIIYSRVSNDAQERDGTSLDTQERASQGYVDAKGWMLVESFKDTASGFSLDRPGIERLRMLLRQGTVDVVVAYAVDRLSRNQNHIGGIEIYASMEPSHMRALGSDSNVQFCTQLA